MKTQDESSSVWRLLEYGAAFREASLFGESLPTPEELAALRMAARAKQRRDSEHLVTNRDAR